MREIPLPFPLPPLFAVTNKENEFNFNLHFLSVQPRNGSIRLKHRGWNGAGSRESKERRGDRERQRLRQMPDGVDGDH